jgi:hypothetical protein
MHILERAPERHQPLFDDVLLASLIDLKAVSKGIVTTGVNCTFCR